MHNKIKERNLKFSFLYFLPFLFLYTADSSFSFQKSKNMYGERGILEMPTAGKLNDGELGFSSSSIGAIVQNTLSFQAFPNIYGALRYTGIGDKPEQYYFSSGYTYWDRSFDLRIDLLNETKFIPDVSVGMQDIIGGGSFSSEYVVASKSIIDQIRLTGGIGWGMMASNQISTYGSRVESDNKFGGGLKYKHLFRGPIGVFGGVEYKTPVENLQIKLEYSSNTRERASHFIPKISKEKINYGLDYFFSDGISLSAYQAYGDEVGLQLNVAASPSSYAGDYLEPVPEPFYSIPLPYEKVNDIFWDNIKKSLEKDKIQLVAYSIKDNEIILVIENNHYSTHTQAIGRTFRVLSKHVPLNINSFRVIISELGIPITEINLDRNDVAAAIDAPNAEFLTNKLSNISPAPKTINGVVKNPDYFRKPNFSILPYYKLHLFDPDQPIYYDVGPRVRLNYNPLPGVFFQFSGVESIYTTFDQIKRGVKGNLPHVRTRMKEYRNVIGPRIESATIASYFKLSSTLYGRFTAGYFEDMYGGLSSELLYFPSNRRFSLGAEINNVKSRDFRQLLKYREEIGLNKVNGHISGYLDTGFFNYIAQLDYGTYLAGDKGSTFTLTRDFRNGWKVGGFFTLTDASFSDFGEGSFDKGIFFSVPLNPAIPFETRSFVSEKIRPIQGDGGARVIVPGRLYGILREKSEIDLSKTWPRIWR